MASPIEVAKPGCCETDGRWAVNIIALCLTVKALDHYLQGPASYLPKALEEPTARQAVQKLLQGAIDMAMNRRHPEGCLLVQGALAAGPACEPIRKELCVRRKSAEALLHRRLERALEEGDLPARAEPAKLARFLITLIWGMSVQAAGGATRADVEELAEVALRWWTNAMMPTFSSAKEPTPAIGRRATTILPRQTRQR